MNELQWALMGVGLLVMGGMILAHSQRSAPKKDSLDRQEPALPPDLPFENDGTPPVPTLKTFATESASFEDELPVMASPSLPVVPPPEPQIHPSAKEALKRAMPAKPSEIDALAQKLGVPERPKTKPERDLVVIVEAPTQHRFSAMEILENAHALNLRLTRSGELHFLVEGPQKLECLLRVGHLQHPGTFVLEKVREMSTSGLIIHLPLPGPLAAVDSVEHLARIAYEFADRLGGGLYDQRRQPIEDLSLWINELHQDALQFDADYKAWSQSP